MINQTSTLIRCDLLVYLVFIYFSLLLLLLLNKIKPNYHHLNSLNCCWSLGFIKINNYNYHFHSSPVKVNHVSSFCQTCKKIIFWEGKIFFFTKEKETFYQSSWSASLVMCTLLIYYLKYTQKQTHNKLDDN